MDGTSRFFERLRERSHEPLLEHVAGTISFQIGDGRGSHWFVSVDDGDVQVSHARRKGDCTVRASHELFEAIASGEANALTAFLRGAVSVEGDPELLVAFERLFPGPPAGRAHEAVR